MSSREVALIAAHRPSRTTRAGLLAALQPLVDAAGLGGRSKAIHGPLLCPTPKVS